VKRIFYFLVSLMLLVVAVYYAWETLFDHDDPGYVMLGIGRWSLESTLAFFTVVLWFSFTVFYLVVRWLGWCIRLPNKIKSKGQNVTLNRSKEALVSGLVDYAEGNWERSEKILIKHAPRSSAPLVYYLTAARAAHLRGAFDSRDSYLNMAADQFPGSEFAIGLTKAELELSRDHYTEAQETLLHLQSLDASHSGLIKLLYQAYLKQDDWQSLVELFPVLDKSKVLLATERKTLALNVYGGLLVQQGEKGDAEDVERLWADIPADIKGVKAIAVGYFTAMIRCGAGARVEAQLVEHLMVDKEDALLELYGDLVSDDTVRQIQIAEQWAQLYPRNAVLLRVVGKLFYVAENWEQAQVFLTRSIELNPAVSAYHMLAEIMAMKGDFEKAAEFFKQGLVMHSNQLVKAIESRPDEPLVIAEDATANDVSEPVSGSDEKLIS